MRLGARAHEAHRHARLAGTPGATDPVNVIVRGTRQIVVHDGGQLRDVDAASSEVGRHQNLQPPRFEIRQRLSSRALTELAMNRLGVESRPMQFFRDMLGRVLGGDEDQHASPAVVANQAK